MSAIYLLAPSPRLMILLSQPYLVEIQISIYTYTISISTVIGQIYKQKKLPQQKIVSTYSLRARKKGNKKQEKDGDSFMSLSQLVVSE